MVMAKYKLTWGERGYTAYPHESEHSTLIGALYAMLYAMFAYDVVETRIIKLDYFNNVK